MDYYPFYAASYPTKSANVLTFENGARKRNNRDSRNALYFVDINCQTTI